tara:strand:+ start:24108 stop:24221 length:114 start_codon:yes stop_codon:yes gene_type:complete
VAIDIFYNGMINAKDTRQGSHKVLKKTLLTDAGQLIR